MLPPAWHLARKLPSWEIVDTKSLDEIGVDWREATFLENPRLAVDDGAEKRAVFEATVRRIKQRKSNGASGRIGVNQFSDLTPEEFWALADVPNDEPAAKPNFFCLGSTLCVT